MVVDAVIVGCSSLVGGLTGFGSSLVSTPMLLLGGLLLPEVALVNLVTTLVTRLAVPYRERRHVNWFRVVLLGVGSLPGSWLGTVTVNRIPSHYLKIVAGTVVVLAGLWLR
jgi:uncharacterized membrane protein YfcA